MPVDYQKMILRRLLSKYEESAHYRGEAATNRRVLLHLGPQSRDWKAYDLDDSDLKRQFHRTVVQLTEQGLLHHEWEPFNRGTVLSAIWLDLDPAKINEAYARIGETPKRELVEQVRQKLSRALADLQSQIDQGNPNTAWICRALAEIGRLIDQKKQLSPWLPDAAAEAEAMLDTLQSLGQADFKDMHQRRFSIGIFRDAKYFERFIRARLIGFAYRFNPLLSASAHDFDDERVLASTGLYNNPEILEFCGPLLLTIGRQAVDFDFCVQGACLNALMIPAIAGIDAGRINRVLFIESRPVYEQLIENGPAVGTLLIYHNGLPSRNKTLFIKQLAGSLAADCSVDHWGDIDLDGLTIYLQLQNLLDRPVRAWRMDRQTLAAMRHLAQPISETYREWLEKALEQPEFAAAADVISAMLAEGVRLEQDAFLMPDAVCRA